MDIVTKVIQNIEAMLDTLFSIAPTEQNGFISYTPKLNRESKYVEGIGLTKTNEQSQRKARVARYAAQIEQTGEINYIHKSEVL